MNSSRFKYNPPKLSIEQLLYQPTATMYGSRALHVNSKDSDFDIAYSNESSDIVKLLMSTGVKPSNPSNYFTVGPESGYYAFLAKVPLAVQMDNPLERAYADILVVHTDEDLDCISSSINDLKSIPSYLLEDKATRIRLYEEALVHRGWKRLPRPADIEEDVLSERGWTSDLTPEQHIRYQRIVERQVQLRAQPITAEHLASVQTPFERYSRPWPGTRW